MPKQQITLARALRAARAKLPILGDKKLQAELDFAVGYCSRCSESRAFAEAFQMGADAAQHIIAGRIAAAGAPKL